MANSLPISDFQADVALINARNSVDWIEPLPSESNSRNLPAKKLRIPGSLQYISEKAMAHKDNKKTGRFVFFSHYFKASI